MKRFVIALVLLVLPALAAPKRFQADFLYPTSPSREADGTAYAWERGKETQLVYVFKDKRSLAQLKQYLRKAMPKGLKPSQETQTRVSGYPALLWEGLNEDGVPYLLVMVSGPRQSLICGSVTYDTGRNRKFIGSLKLSKL